VRGWLPLAAALTGCATDGDLYGGGAGLTLSFDMPGGAVEMHWDGADKSALREVNGGLLDSKTTWDPVALVASSGTWSVRADDAFDATTSLDLLGIDCFGAGRAFTAYANDTSFGFTTEISLTTGESAYLQVVGVYGPEDAPDVLEGEGRAPAQWAGDLDACDHGELPDVIEVSWAFDEEVRVPNKCLDCNLPEFDIDLDFDFDLTF